MCPAGVCTNNECVASSKIIYVAEGGDGTACTFDAPCPSLADTVPHIRGSRTTILVRPGTYEETETLASTVPFSIIA